MINKETIEENIKDSRGKYYKLKVASEYSHISSEEFLPEKLYCADAYRYTIYSVDDNDQSEEKEIDDLELKQAVVEKLKIIHKIRDPWDDDMDFFRKKVSDKEVSLKISMKNNILNDNGEYILLALNPFFKDIKTEDFIAGSASEADYLRYQMMTYNPIVEMYGVTMGGNLDPAKIKYIKNVYYGIKDPWDDDPGYLERLNKEQNEELDRTVEEKIRDEKGEYCLLKLNPAYEDFSKEKFFPDNLNYPDANRYIVYSVDKDSGKHNVRYVENRVIKDEMVKKLKKIYDIHDPWDGDPDYFHNKYEKISKENPDIFWETRSSKNRKENIYMKFGKKQAGERKIEIFLYSERKAEIKEIWHPWLEESNIKVISWPEIDDKDKREEPLFRDRTIILENSIEDGSDNWRLIYEKLSKPYRKDESGNKTWVDSDNCDIEFFKTYSYSDNIRVKLKRKRFGYSKKLV